MFLHEPGEQTESFTRQDLSSMNAASTQQPTAPMSPGGSHPPLPQPPPQHTQPVAAATQENIPTSPTDSSADGPGLPARSNWANQPRRESRSTMDSNASPVVATSVPARAGATSRATRSGNDSESEAASTRPTSAASARKQQTVPAKDSPFNNLIKTAFDPEIKFSFSPNGLSEQDLQVLRCFPPLWDPNGGVKRRIMKEQEIQQRRQQEEAQADLRITSNPEVEDQNEGAGGSLQLGGEPEERPDRGFGQGHHVAIQPPAQGFGNANLGHTFSLGDELPARSDSANRGVTPLQSQQQQQLLLQQLRNTSTSHPQVAHGRNNSRFDFANASNASTGSTIKPHTMLKQQASVVNQGNHYSTLAAQQQALGSQFYTSGVQGPPPGLKTTGTPPVSGGGMFGQGHGFTPGVGYGGNAPGRDSDKMWDLHRGQRGNPDAGKREFFSTSFLPHPSTSTPAPASGHLNFPYGAQAGTVFQETGGPQKQKKKGKKHRHANTSSSGGGGVVDSADPSILQARLHPNGASGITGQGLYGAGQGQGGFSSMYGNMSGARW
jgi:CCR4-NOT transcription complex subunit 4